MNTKGAVLLIGLFVLAASVRHVHAAPDVEAWQTYRNAKYGYSIQYPEDFEAWPTGPAGSRDGRAIRIGRKEHAAPTPMLDIHMQVEAPAVESLIESPDMDVTVGSVEIQGVRAREVTYRWKSNGDLVFVTLYLRDTAIEFHAHPGLRDFRKSVWWEIVSTFRFQDE
jgi:hypothetical protein